MYTKEFFMTTARTRFGFRPRVWLQRIHLWATLTFGLILLVVTTSGALALFHHEVDQALEPKYYKVTPGPAIGFEQAWKTIKRAHPNEPVSDVIRANDTAPYYARIGVDNDKSVYVDPGTGQINGVKGVGGTLMGWFANLHTSLFLNEAKFPYPAWTPEWIKKWIGESLGELLLKLTALALGLMVISGAVLWWPGIKKMAYSFKLRRQGSVYVRQYDWHKIIGFVGLPFLAMWGLTAMNFYEPFHPIIEKTWLTATFANVQLPPDDLKSDFKGKTAKDQLSILELRTIAERELPQGSKIINLGVPDLSAKFKDKDAEKAAREQTVTVWGSHGLDPWKYGEFPGNYSVTIDQYSGKVLDTNAKRLDSSWGANIFENWFYPIHAGIAVPWWARFIWFTFGMLPLFLAVTGMRMYLLKRGQRIKKRRTTFEPALAADD
jgi:uncharacterized iron-regulated membrane protein